MKIISTIPGFALHQVRSWFYGRSGALLAPGTAAPDFDLPDESGRRHRLSQYRGKSVVLFWFIRASTPG